MKLGKLLSLTLLLFVFFSSVNLYSQYASRSLPMFLDAEYYNAPQTSLNPKGQIYWPTAEFPTEFSKANKGDRLLSEDGITLIPMTKSSGQSETWIAVNPADPNNIVAGSNDFRYNGTGNSYRMGVYYTTDGGETFVDTKTPENLGLYIDRYSYPAGMTNFDPGVAFDDEGKCYYCYGFAVTNTSSQADNGVFVTRSDDGGKTWNEPIPVALEYGLGSPFHDRYMITADAVSNEEGLMGNVYVAWMLFDGSSSGVVFSKSTNEGETWSSYKKLPGSSYSSQGPTPVVGPDGEVYVAFLTRNYNTGVTYAKVQKSTNGGTNWWSSARTAMQVYSSGTRNTSSGRYVLDDKSDARVSSYPAIAVDASDGEHRGNVYVIQSGKESYNGKEGLYFTKSTNGGGTWTDRKKIDNNELGNDIMFPSATVDKETGTLAILYYSSQNDPNNQKTDVYIAVSVDGGETFEHIRLTPNSVPVRVNMQGTGNYYWGDYTGITSFHGVIYPSFWLPNAGGSFYSLVAYTAKLSPKPFAPENVSFETNPDPVNIILSWDDPTKNMFGVSLKDFEIVITRDGKEIGTVKNGVCSFTDNNVESGKEFQYTLKTKVSDKLVSDLVYINVTAGGKLQPKPPTELVSTARNDGFTLNWTNPSEHVDNTHFYDFEELRIYADGELVKTLTKAEYDLALGEESSILIDDLQTEKFYKISMKAVGLRDGVTTESAISEEIIVYSGKAFTSLDETFDDPDNALPFYTDGWGFVDVKGNKAFTDSPEGNYGKNQKNIFILAPMTISPDNTTLSLDIIPIIHPNNDYAEIATSTDLKNWRRVVKYNIDSLGGFSANIEDNEWRRVHRYLGNYVGENVYIRFTVFSDNLLERDGWYIDNITIDDEPASVREDIFAKSLNLSVYPNPTEGASTLKVDMPLSGQTIIAIYDALGNRINEIENSMLGIGMHEYPLGLDNLSSGYYYCRVSVDNVTKTKAIILTK